MSPYKKDKRSILQKIKIIFLASILLSTDSIIRLTSSFVPTIHSYTKKWSHHPFINTLTYNKHCSKLFTASIDRINGAQETQIPTVSITCSNNNTDTNLMHTSAVLNISYDGRNYYGWSSSNDDTISNPKKKKSQELRQRRSKRRRGKYYGPLSNTIKSIEGTLQNALGKLYGNVSPQSIKITGCSRTDKGVHAKSYICSFECTTIAQLPFEGDICKLVYVLNRMLPDDIRVNAASYLPYKDFHPTVDALVKTYQYTFSVGSVHDPLTSRYTWNVPSSNFHIDKVIECSYILQGTHNFTAFQGAFRGSDRIKKHSVNTYCNITNIEIASLPDNHIVNNVTSKSFRTYNSIQTYKVTITGTRFLYKMMRFIVGALVSVGKGTIEIEDVEYVLCHGIRNENMLKYVTCAPSHGLTSVHEQYDTFGDESFDWCR